MTDNDLNKQGRSRSSKRAALWVVVGLALSSTSASALIASSAPSLAAQQSVDCTKVSTKKSSGDDFDDFAAGIDDMFNQTDCEVQQTFNDIDRQIMEAFQQAQREIEGMWGGEAVLPSRDRWVGYSDDLKDRVIVDYREGTVTVQSVGDQSEERLKELLDNTLKSTEQDLTNIDPVIRKLNDTPKSQPDPLEQGWSKRVRTPRKSAELGRLVDPSTIKVETYDKPKPRREELASPPSPNEDGQKIVPRPRPKPQPPARPVRQRPAAPKKQITVKFDDNWHERNAEKYFDFVSNMSGRYDLKPSLIFAIIHTESSFNPRARSGAPAYGLMQLVPTSGGLDAWRALGKGDSAPDPDFLYDPLTNIELGATYFDILMSRYLRRIEQFEKRKYASISAYNTGAGNVMRSFGKGTSIKDGAQRINAMSSEALKDHLIANLPYDETRRYLQKVLKFQELYVKFDRT